MSRLCRDCGARLPWLSDHCHSCSAAASAPTPWYVYLLGAVMFAALVLWMTDLDSLARLLGR
ncbi:MAG: hypothetical protein U1E53_33210 [Dongiaceae bacterium]